jgi:hypothetical protein
VLGVLSARIGAMCRLPFWYSGILIVLWVMVALALPWATANWIEA